MLRTSRQQGNDVGRFNVDVTSGLGYALGNTMRACCSTLTRYNYVHAGFILADLSDLFETVCCKFSSAQCKQLPFYVTTRLIENKLWLNVTVVTEVKWRSKIPITIKCCESSRADINLLRWTRKNCNEKWRFSPHKHFRALCEFVLCFFS